MNRTRLAILLAGLLSGGCAATRLSLEAAHLSHQVSMTRSVVGKDGKPLVPSADSVVHHFSASWWQVALLYGAIQCAPEQRDVSEFLDGLIVAHGGDAIVNLHGSWNLDPLWYIVVPFGVIPTYGWITLEGDIVRLEAP